jgi:integrase
MAPEIDWGWLMDISRQIDHQSFPRPKANRVRTSDEIAALGRKLIEGADAASETSSPNKIAALDYRDGLMLLVLAYAPLRRRNLAALEVGRTLVKAGDGWTIALPANETKSHKDEEYALPVYVSRCIDRYLSIYRPIIFASSTHNGFFASAKGCALPPDGAYQAICQRTLTEFGVEVNPHLLRDGSQTMWALENPKQIRAAGALLGHANPKTGERHYNQAKSISAARRLSALLTHRVRKLR